MEIIDSTDVDLLFQREEKMWRGIPPYIKKWQLTMFSAANNSSPNTIIRLKQPRDVYEGSGLTDYREEMTTRR